MLVPWRRCSSLRHSPLLESYAVMSCCTVHSLAKTNAADQGQSYDAVASASSADDATCSCHAQGHCPKSDFATGLVGFFFHVETIDLYGRFRYGRFGRSTSKRRMANGFFAKSFGRFCGNASKSLSVTSATLKLSLGLLFPESCIKYYID